MFNRSRDVFAEAEPQQQPKESMIKTVVIPLGSLFVAALGLFGKDMPVWAPWAIAVYIGIVIVWLAVIPFGWFIYRWIRTFAHDRSISNRFFPQFRNFVTVLLPHLEESRHGTVFSSWKSIGQSPEGRNFNSPQHVIYPEVDHLRTLRLWLNSIAGRLAIDNHARFREIANELGEFVSQYSRFCEEAHRQLDMLCVHGNLEATKLRGIKQEWNQVRDKHNLTIKTWEDAAKTLNAALGERICFDHFQSLKTIE